MHNRLQSTLTIDIDELAQRVQDLPPELFSMIYEYACSVGGSTVIQNKPGQSCRLVQARHCYNITTIYRPPAMLHVDSVSRKKFAEAYYANEIFCVVDLAATDTLCRWMASLAAEHLASIFMIKMPMPADASDERMVHWMRYLFRRLDGHGVTYGRRQIQIIRADKVLRYSGSNGYLEDSSDLDKDICHAECVNQHLSNHGTIETNDRANRFARLEETFKHDEGERVGKSNKSSMEVNVQMRSTPQVARRRRH